MRATATWQSLGWNTRPDVHIELAGQTEHCPNSYTTGDIIEGAVSIGVDCETSVDELAIIFEGFSETQQSQVIALPSQAKACHTFLELHQPIGDADYPTRRTFLPGRIYRFPFIFVVPERLPSPTCGHAKCNIHVGRAHTLLPPSLGDPMLASDGRSLLDDMSSELCRISYRIRTSLTRRCLRDRTAKETLRAVAKKVRIIPAMEEEPLLAVHNDGNDYCMQNVKDIKTGVARTKRGSLVVIASQPSPLQLCPPGSQSPSNVCTTVATVYLRFNPAGDEPPPKLGSLSSKLSVSTFYAITPWANFPSPSYVDSLGRHHYTTSVSLSSLCVSSTKWTKHGGVRMPGKSALVDLSRTEPFPTTSATEDRGTYYTAAVIVPITLPRTKAFVPTFHSCLIARTYALDLSICYHTPNASLLTPSISLRLPIQVTSLPRSQPLTQPPLYSELRTTEIAMRQGEN
ncbi:arrestin (or S-antigen) [Aspergillus bombycis]|uniref:Arrestin (Or S-antigen) n=1 Tax=Aspergillus bombycis TaxID=109264 RepID=A0A1F8AG87_9EURO|nr:arrestin (or S-antigen) [Aspergillus bombycis]OGM50754.1 arrestin (or S-antigen) [Aspergillus bombycis]